MKEPCCQSMRAANARPIAMAISPGGIPGGGVSSSPSNQRA